MSQLASRWPWTNAEELAQADFLALCRPDLRSPAPEARHESVVVPMSEVGRADVYPSDKGRGLLNDQRLTGGHVEGHS